MTYMTLQQLADVVNEQLAMQKSSAEARVCVKVHRPGTVGGTPTVNVKYASLGFDWDSNSFIISTVDPVQEVK
jgi:hypothetical protein